MFSRIQANRFRSLKAIDQPLTSFQALIGPNASGKTTFLDVIGLLSDVMRDRGSIQEAVFKRSKIFTSLLWRGEGTNFQLALEAPIPDVVRDKLAADKKHFDLARYEVEIAIDAVGNEIGFNSETLWLTSALSGLVVPPIQREIFPELRSDEIKILSKQGAGKKVLLKKTVGGNDNFYPDGSKSYRPSFKLGRTKSALANVPADDDSFPVGLWFKELLETGIHNLVLNSQLIRQPSAPGQGLGFTPDGSNLPWVVYELSKNKDRFAAWLAHVQSALPDIKAIQSIERPEDKHRYLNVIYSNGASVPSWLVSDGTLRLLALTVVAYIEGISGVYLVEEPENGIHPRAIETVLESLGSIRGGQMLMATHSPIALNILDIEQVLCFAKDLDGATDIVAGKDHPALRNWKADGLSLGTLFATGILS